MFKLYKTYSKEINTTKLIVLVIVNTWLLIIFWKILLVENVFIGNNVGLTKLNTVIQPVLMYLGLEGLSANTIKMLIVTMIVLGVNITILHFNTVVVMVIPLGLARYMYKMYTNYLINSENMLKATLKTENIAPKLVEQAPLVINTGSASGTNWWLWGTVILVGALAVGGIVLTIWSHQTNAINIAQIGTDTRNIANTLNTKIDNVNERVTRNISQIDYNNNYTTKMCNNVDTKIDLVNEKVTNLETGFQDFGEKIVKLESNNIENVKLLSESTLEISKEAKEFFGNVIESNTATEALIVSIAKLVDGFDLLSEKLITIETRLDTITGQTVTTPRPSGMFRAPTLNIRNNNDNL